MANRPIHKDPLTIPYAQIVHGLPLAVGLDPGGEPSVWYVVGAPACRVMTCGTGGVVEGGWEHIGSFVHGEFVIHAFMEPA